MIEGLQLFVSEKEIFTPTDRLLVAVSGGVDSVVLCHLLKQAGQPFAIAHCNFNLRGKESDLDEQFVQGLAQQLSVNFFSQHFNTLDYAKENKISIQMAARELRYEWLNRFIEEDEFDYIATAHHKNDITETILLNLARGTGIRGLHGILPNQNQIVRPLLWAGKEQILGYAQKNNIQFREDASNKETYYQRNLLRHKVIPELQQINPSLIDSVAATAEKLYQTEQFYKHHMQQVIQSIIIGKNDKVYVDIKLLLQQAQPSLVLYELLSTFGFSASVIQDVYRHLDGQSGKVFYSSTYQVVKDRQHLILNARLQADHRQVKIHEEDNIVTAPYFTLVTCQTRAAQFPDIKMPKVAYLDFSKLKFPLTLRPWQPGDFFIPYGLKGKKKISDFLIDEKVPLSNKDMVYVLDSRGAIVWVVGYRVDDRFAVTKKTTMVYRLEVRN